MAFLITKFLVTSLIIVLVSEVAKRTDKVGALIASLPFVTMLVMIWLYVEKQGSEKIANHAYYTLWYVVPTLPMFALIFRSAEGVSTKPPRRFLRTLSTWPAGSKS